jgi:hypothetical protein
LRPADEKCGLSLLPQIAGMALVALWQARLWTNPILYLRADVGALLLLLSLAGSAMIAFG